MAENNDFGRWLYGISLAFYKSIKNNRKR